MLSIEARIRARPFIFLVCIALTLLLGFAISTFFAPLERTFYPCRWFVIANSYFEFQNIRGATPVVIDKGWVSLRHDVWPRTFRDVVGDFFRTPTVSPSRGVCIIPLGSLSLALLLIAMYCFWRPLRKQIVGHCSQCGYDLTENTSGRCPECGLLLPRPLSVGKSNLSEGVKISVRDSDRFPST